MPQHVIDPLQRPVKHGGHAVIQLLRESNKERPILLERSPQELAHALPKDVIQGEGIAIALYTHAMKVWLGERVRPESTSRTEDELGLITERPDDQHPQPGVRR
jgi:hypothetical protein